MLNRSYTCNRVPKEELEQGIDKSLFWDYTPTQEAIAVNRARIQDRLQTKLSK